MPITPTYPGVYIEELPSPVRTIVGVSTSITAFVGYFPRGPLNVPVRLLSIADFEREFGGLHRDSETSYAIQQFFLNGGNETWVVRVAHNQATADLDPSATPAATANVEIQGISTNTVLRVKAGRRVRGRLVDNPGQWGNRLRIEVDYDTAAPGRLFNLTVKEVGDDGRSVLATETFRNLSMDEGAVDNAVEIVNEGSKLVQLEIGVGWPTERPAVTGTVGTPITTATTTMLTPITIPNEGDEFYIEVTEVDTTTLGPWTVTIRYGGAPTPPDLRSFRPYLEAAIRETGRLDETRLRGAVVQLMPTDTALTYQLRVLAGPDFEPGTLLSFSDVGSISVAADLGLTGVDTTENIQQYSPTIDVSLGSVGYQSGATMGNDGSLPNATVLLGQRNDKTGLFALRDVDLFNILCVPRAADLDADEMRAFVSEALGFCEERRAMMIVDIPKDRDTVPQMETWMAENDTLRHNNAAVYFPRPLIADSLNGYRLKSVAASGTIAGLYARTDASRGVWKAPSGTEASLRGVQELDYKLTDAENGVLNPLGINCLRTFPVYGNVCWGGRTLMGSNIQASEWKYLPVRRIALYIEESLYRGTQWVVFEPNDEPLWSQVRLNVGAFMNRLFRQGAFQGSSPRDAYFVKCNKETTTQDDIDQGIVNILVGFAPLKPAEFVIIKISQIASQIPT